MRIHKMDGNKLILFMMVAHLCCGVNSTDSNSTLSTINNKTPTVPQSNVTYGEKTDTFMLGESDLVQAMKICNESYQIPINYMEELNVTGSYPDETEKLPMCFMKCYLEMVGVVSSENDVAIKQAMLHFSTSEDIINDCLKEQSDIDNLDSCEYAYFLTRCITMSTLVDNRKSDT